MTLTICQPTNRQIFRMGDAVRKWLRALRAEFELDQSQLGERLGVSRSSIAMYETGSPIPEYVLEKIREAFPQAPPYPLEESSMKSVNVPKLPRSDGRHVSLAGTPLVPIPVVGQVQAGPGASNVDPDQSSVYVPDRLARPDWIGWQVAGDSMMPSLEPGDVAVFQSQSSPRKGYPFLLEKDGEFRFKVADWIDGKWVARSLNPSYPIEPIDGWRILGILVGYYRLRGSRETLDLDPGGLKLE